MLNREVIRNILTKVALGVSLTEKETFILQAVYGVVEDKDAPTTLNQAEAMNAELEALENEFFNLEKDYDRLNRKALVCNVKHTIKGHRKDKAKAGLHRGSKHEGWGHYDRWLKPETLRRDAEMDLKAQMESINEVEDVDLEEVKQNLTKVFGMDLNGMNQVYYHYAEEFVDLSEWNATVRSWMEKHLQKMPNEGEVYSYLEENYPIMGMSDMKNLVESFLGAYRMAILMGAGSMWRYCQNSYKDYWQSVVMDLHEEYHRLEDLTKEVEMGRSIDITDKDEDFIIVLAGIKVLKERLEEMDKANAKFI